MNSLKSLAMNCGPLSEMIRGRAAGYFSLARCKNDFNVSFGHLLPDLPMDDGAAASIQKAAQVVEGATDVEVRNIHMPVFMRQQRLNEPGPFERRFLVPLLKHACF